MLSLTNIYVIPHELLFPIPPQLISIYTNLPLFSIVLAISPLPLFALVGEFGVVLLTPLCTRGPSVNYVLLSHSSEATPSNTTSITAPGGVNVRVLPMKSVITPWVPTWLTFVGSPSTVSAEFPFPFWV